MLLLLVVLWLLGVLARDDSHKDTKYVIKHISSCPDVGYYFRRETSPNSLESVCYLCFCQNDGTAICWQRENKRCDATHYQHGVGKRDTRIRRSPVPVGFSDIFFRDAARDIFDKQLPQTCKPYESSFSEGCPPADWCVGCTVCDCDANGRWDCHILSFCPDKKDKKKLKTKKKPLRDGWMPKRTTQNEVPQRTTRTTSNKKPTTKKGPPKQTPAPKRTTVNNANQAKKNVKKVSPVKQPNKNTKQEQNTSSKSNKNAPKRSNTSPKPLIIKKDAKSKNPKVVKPPRRDPPKPKPAAFPHTNETALITQEIYKKVISAMQTFLDKRIRSLPPVYKPTVKSAQKRSMVKRNVQNTKNIQNSKNTKIKVNGHFKPTADKKIYNPKNIKPKNIKSVKKPGKVNKQGGTNKKETKPNGNNGKRNKRDANDYNVTTTLRVITENSSYKNTEVPVTLQPNSTLTENETIANLTTTNDYYKYTMITPPSSIVTDNLEKIQIVYALTKNETKIDDNVTNTPKKRDKENHFDEIQAIVLNSSASEVKHDNISRKQISVEKDMYEFNDLKFNDWPQIKLLKNNHLITKLVNVNATKKAEKASNLTIVKMETSKKKHIGGKDVARVISPSYRKYNRSKIINKLNCYTNNSTRWNIINFRERISNKINDLQNAVKRVLVDVNKNNTKKMKPKPRRFNVIKYFKRFFSKMFRRYKHLGKNTMDDQTELNNRIIDSICEGLSNCDMAQKNNLLLRYKIRDLNKESFTIIRSIKIIKGLLHLLDFPTSTELIDGQNRKFKNAKSSLKNDIRKLNAVLKDKYINNNTPLTSTQMTQIRYIKNNTQSFVKSVGKFANILNEIITILTKKQNIDEKRKHAFKTFKRSYENNTKLSNDTSKDLKQLKGLLVKYNYIQNEFVRNMYKLLSKFEKVQENYTNAKESNEKKVTTATVEQFSGNIINNLRKLKSLANVLNLGRRKRDTSRDDDGMEYLLTLMEYMLKQNYPLDASPINDGIDLLLEAIKSAPDIKPIKKKVLQAIPVNIRISRTTEPVPDSILGEDNSYDSRKINDDISVNDTRSEDTRSENNGSENTRSETGEQNSNQENEKDEQFKFVPGKNIFELDAKVNTEKYYDKNSNQIDTTVIPVNVGIFGNVEEETTDNNNFKKIESAFKANRKFEVFNSDLDDEDVGIVNTTTTTDIENNEVENTVTVTVPYETTEFKLKDVKKMHSNINSVEVSGKSDGEKRIGLDWLEEGYDDFKEVRQVKNTMPTPTQAPVVVTTKAVQTDNVSVLTREVIDEEKRKVSNINVEDVMFKKQMDLLNSLDYGTERSENDDVESKEGDERYSGDSPSY